MTIRWLLEPASLTAPAGIGHGPRSLSGLLVDIGTVVVPAAATLIGSTLSSCSPAPAPILLTIFREFGWSPKVSTGTFQKLVEGKIEQTPTGCANAKPLNASKAT